MSDSFILLHKYGITIDRNMTLINDYSYRVSVYTKLPNLARCKLRNEHVKGNTKVIKNNQNTGQAKYHQHHKEYHWYLIISKLPPVKNHENCRHRLPLPPVTNMRNVKHTVDVYYVQTVSYREIPPCNYHWPQIWECQIHSWCMICPYCISAG